MTGFGGSLAGRACRHCKAWCSVPASACRRCAKPRGRSSRDNLEMTPMCDLCFASPCRNFIARPSRLRRASATSATYGARSRAHAAATAVSRDSTATGSPAPRAGSTILTKSCVRSGDGAMLMVLVVSTLTIGAVQPSAEQQTLDLSTDQQRLELPLGPLTSDGASGAKLSFGSVRARDKITESSGKESGRGELSKNRIADFGCGSNE